MMFLVVCFLFITRFIIYESRGNFRTIAGPITVLLASDGFGTDKR